MNSSFEPKTQGHKRRASHDERQSAIAYPSRTIVHAKLEMTEPGDHDEQEADAVAKEVVSGGKIARMISGEGVSSGIAVSRQMESRLLQQQGGGQPMPSGLRSKMESSFGREFSQVRLHTDSEAAALSRSIHAKAFTHGNDIYFNHGQFAPETPGGLSLMAHELTHVVQGNGKVSRDVITNVVKSEKMRKKNCTTSKLFFAEEYGQCQDNYLNDSESETIIYLLFIAKDMLEYVISELSQFKNDYIYDDYFGSNPPRVILNNYVKILNVINKSLFGKYDLYIHRGKSKKDTTIAYTYNRDKYYEIALCDPFFNDQRTEIDNAATLIHELSHEEIYTEDEKIVEDGKERKAYDEVDCLSLSDSKKANNAQNYAFFARDLYLRRNGGTLDRKIATEYMQCVDGNFFFESNENCDPNRR